jgi:hypothetical protein
VSTADKQIKKLEARLKGYAGLKQSGAGQSIDKQTYIEFEVLLGILKKVESKSSALQVSISILATIAAVVLYSGDTQNPSDYLLYFTLVLCFIIVALCIRAQNK